MSHALNYIANSAPPLVSSLCSTKSTMSTATTSRWASSARIGTALPSRKVESIISRPKTAKEVYNSTIDKLFIFLSLFLSLRMLHCLVVSSSHLTPTLQQQQQPEVADPLPPSSVLSLVRCL